MAMVNGRGQVVKGVPDGFPCEGDAWRCPSSLGDGPRRLL